MNPLKQEASREEKCPRCGSNIRIVYDKGCTILNSNDWHKGSATAQTPVTPKEYKNRYGDRLSLECYEGNHDECTDTYETCACTYRGLHKTMHAYLNAPIPGSAPPVETQETTMPTGPLCDNCGKSSREHYCWIGMNTVYHPSESRAKAVSPALESTPPIVCNCGKASMVVTNHDISCNLRRRGSTETQPPNFATEDWCYEHAHSLPCRICASIPTREGAIETQPTRNAFPTWEELWVMQRELSRKLVEKEAELATAKQKWDEAQKWYDRTEKMWLEETKPAFAAQSRELERLRGAILKRGHYDTCSHALGEQYACDCPLGMVTPDSTPPQKEK